MPLRRLHRRCLTWLLAFCVLFAQSLAVAYACQRGLPGAIEAQPPCTAHLNAGNAPLPAENGNVCEVHCEPASLPHVAVPDLPPLVAVVAWWLPATAVASVPTAPHDELEARSTSPPARTLFARLLI